MLSVLLRYTDSDCPFGIFKLFLQNICVTNDHVICSVSRNHNPVPCSMTYHMTYSKSNMTGDTSEAITAYRYDGPEYNTCLLVGFVLLKQ